jgi:hypothetical protein
MVKDIKDTKNTKGGNGKRQPSKYNIYVKEQSPILKSQNPTLKQTDIMKLIGESWRMKNN